MTPDRSHSDTVGLVANKVRVERCEAPFNPYFYVPKYRTSDALPAPEIFLFFLMGQQMSMGIMVNVYHRLSIIKYIYSKSGSTWFFIIQ